MMARAVFLAERGRGLTSPNPIVGAVVVGAEGVVVGQGAHLKAGEAHAEVHALQMAGPRARGATLYCTLEPCCHVGRTGPCVEKVADAGITRVVTAVEDPNPLVAGKGHAWLRAQGIEVATGVGEAEARRGNAPFLTWMAQRRPWTLLKVAVSVDGTVGEPGARLSGPVADRWMHRQRAWIDAIVVGSGTVLADDPRLTPRGAWRVRPLTRVVIDWRGRVPATATVFGTQATGPVIMVCLEDVPGAHRERLTAAGVQVVTMPSANLADVSSWLGANGIQSLLVEGGPTLQEAWARTAPVDVVQWLATPTRAGGRPVAQALQDWRADAEERASTRRLMLGADELIEGTWS
ncbi:MAG: riboflavin biosynthesis protein RibD [Acidimicrobiia bacterium]|jgi:diaminohydroxyphosphoribosylaminopyrimidine deaminase/5-amino-6-(5-phosphoribosylamino)uracil reductase